MGRLRILKAIFWLLLIGVLGLSGYALLSDLPAPVREASAPITLPGEGL